MRSLYKWDSSTKTFIEIYTDKPDPKAPLVRTGEMPPTESPVDGKVYTNWTKYKKHLKQHGYAIYPVAEQIEANKTPRPKSMGQAWWKEQVEKCHMDVKYGRVKFSEIEKEQHLREERQCQAYLKRQR